MNKKSFNGKYLLMLKIFVIASALITMNIFTIGCDSGSGSSSVSSTPTGAADTPADTGDDTTDDDTGGVADDGFMVYFSSTDETVKGGISLRWTPFPDAVTYHVFRAESEGGPFTEITDPAAGIVATNTTYTDYTALYYITYYYRVRACNDIGCSEYSTTDSGRAQWKEDTAYDVNNPVIYGKIQSGVYVYGNGLGEFNAPSSVAVDSAGKLFVADASNWRIQRLNNGTWTAKGSYSATPVLGQFSSLYGVAVDKDGLVYASDMATARITVFSNELDSLYITPTPTGAPDTLLNPHGIAVDSNGFLYIADTDKHRVIVAKYNPVSPGSMRFIGWFGADTVPTTTGVWHPWTAQTIAIPIPGTAPTQTPASGTADGAFNKPLNVAVDSKGYVYVTDSLNYRIQKLKATYIAATATTPDAVTLSFEGWWGYDGTVSKFHTSGNTPGVQFDDGTNNDNFPSYPLQFGQYEVPEGIAVDVKGFVYITDNGTFSERVEKVAINNYTVLRNYGFLTYFGAGHLTYPGGFMNCKGIAVSSTGLVYVADTGNHRIQCFSMVAN